MMDTNYPIGFTELISVRDTPGTAAVLLHQTGSVFVSDGCLMGYLGAYGLDPISDRPREINGRLYWAFPQDQELTIREHCRDFYGLYTGAFNGAFVRKAMKLRKAYSSAAKSVSGRNHSELPLSLRRL